MRTINPKLRVSLYIVVAAAGAVLVTYGIIEQTVVDALLPVIAGVLAVAGGGVAAANTSVKPRESDPSVLEWARMGQAAIPALINEVQRNRAVPVESTYSGPSSVPSVTPNSSGLPVYQIASSAVEAVNDTRVQIDQGVNEIIGQARGVADQAHELAVEYVGQHRGE